VIAQSWAFAARNIFRHRGRSAITLAAIAFGVAALTVSGGFVRDLYLKLGEAIIHSQTGHLQVARAELFAAGSRSPEKHLISEVEPVRNVLAALPGVRQVSSRLSFAGLLSNHRSDLPIIGEGIEPERERDLMSSITLIAGTALEPGDPAGVLVGEGLAAALALKPGDPVIAVASTIAGAMNTADLEVVGVFRSFSQDYDARALKLPLAVAQRLMGTQGANAMVVLLERTDMTAATAMLALQAVTPQGLTVRTWEELNEFYASTVNLFERQFAVLNLIILLMAALGVSNAVNMAVFERLAEFGTMRALGNRAGFVIRLIMTECVFLGLLGAAIGVLAGSALALLISAVGIPMPPPPNSNIGYIGAVQVAPMVVLEAFLVGLVAAVLAGVVPALRVARIPIVDALRHA